MNNKTEETIIKIVKTGVAVVLGIFVGKKIKQHNNGNQQSA
jgi:hypothetical protein